MEIQSFFWYIMSVEKNKRLRKQTFVFHKPLTKVPPAKQAVEHVSAWT